MTFLRVAGVGVGGDGHPHLSGGWHSPVAWLHQVTVKSCFVLKETSSAQSTVIVFLDVEQPDMVVSEDLPQGKGP